MVARRNVRAARMFFPACMKATKVYFDTKATSMVEML
jgi:hypothetical protein